MTNQDIAFLSFIIVIAIIYYAGLWRIFEKAGEKGWKAIIPFYNTVTSLKIIGKEWYWVFIMLIPGINIIYFFFGILFELYRSFGKEKLSDQLLGIFFFFGYVAYLGFSPKEKYIGQGAKMAKPKKSQAREWADAIVFAVIAATIIRWLLLEAFKIPTPSMERTLLMGDFLFVSKVHYGPRTPMTPLQVPLTHQSWWWNDKSKSHSELIQLPQYRLPGLTEIKNNDVVVFNYPKDDNHNPVDLKTNYIKRCLAIAGDSFQIIKKNVYINGKLVSNPPKTQFKYKVYTEDRLPNKVIRNLDIPNYRNATGDYRLRQELFRGENKPGYEIDLSLESVEKLKALGYKVEPVMEVSETSFPAYGNGWTVDDYGPIWVPKKGAKIQMTSQNVENYAETIMRYEDIDTVSVTGEAKKGNLKLFIGGKEVKEYTFKRDYYFMIGDNRHNSADSRYFGFVPDNYVVGKALFIWFSSDPDPSKGLFKSIRWNRIFNGIK